MIQTRDTFYRQVETELWSLYKHFPASTIDTLDDESISKFIYDSLKTKTQLTKDLIKVNSISNITNIDNIQDIKKRVSVIRNYRKQLLNLQNIPQVKQRTPEWYNMRKERLTASATAQAIGKGKFGNRNQLLQSKAFPDSEKWFPTTSGPMYHGTMLEEMTSRCYSQRNNDIRIYDFGMIKHPSLDCYGASPDGITELGIMIEIKTPYRRKVDGNIPEEYLLQMQGQMAACELHECEFVDCKIDLIYNEKDYLELNAKDMRVDHGIIIETRDASGTPVFKYSPEYLTPEECIQWKNDNIKEMSTGMPMFSVLKTNYWKLYNIIATRVYFDNDLWNSLEPQIRQFWNDVIALRSNPELNNKKSQIVLDIDDKTKKMKYDFIESDSDNDDNK